MLFRSFKRRQKSGYQCEACPEWYTSKGKPADPKKIIRCHDSLLFSNTTVIEFCFLSAGFVTPRRKRTNPIVPSKVKTKIYTRQYLSDQATRQTAENLLKSYTGTERNKN